MNLKLRNIPFSPPDITEAEANLVKEALLSGWITTGPKTKEFERRIASFCHTSKAVCLNSATAAMELTLRVLGIGPGDEIIVPAYTYTATASVGLHVGAKVVMVDSQANNVQMDYDALERAITPRTKVIMPVDLGGIVCDYERIMQIVEAKRALFTPDNDIQRAFGRCIVLADAAHAFGAQWHGKMCGEIADFTSFSFHAVKNLTTAEGGAVVWRDIPGIDNEELYHQYQLLSLHGQNKDALAKTQLGAWEYDIKGAYFKCNMTDIMAAIGLVQLDRYPALLKRRREIIGQYNNGLKDLNVKVLNHYSDTHASSGHLYLVRMPDKTLEQRNAIITRMAELGVATNVHYKPLPMMTAYRALGLDIKDYPNAYNLFHNEITLPLHTRLSNEDIEYILTAFHEATL
ncbi:MAG: DegT/DnrJ/EryC1/StrS family aminotransferase [Paludibacteraceae bacterium]|nr:DegT/DnrJ/EryC1/StrS family aminotransferase [Paludibacteraceae bacterium]